MVTGVTPDRVTTDGHDSYPRAIRTVLGAGVRHRDSQYLNNRLEQDHRGVKGRYGPMRGSSAHDRLATSVVPTTSYATFSVPAPEPISQSPPTTAGSTSFAAPQRF
jgi:transposase-like protein